MNDNFASTTARKAWVLLVPALALFASMTALVPAAHAAVVTPSALSCIDDDT